ncbi:MAG: hypothetical protein ACI3XH_04205 [Phascolarctobacterium sp.]
MLNLLNGKVSHKSLGEGTVVAVDEEVITVQFASKTSKFTFPAAFEKFLTAQNPAVASMIQGMLGDIKAAEAKAKAEQKARIEQRLAESKVTIPSRPASKNTVVRPAKYVPSPADIVYDVPTIESLDELLDNCATLDGYIKSGKDPEYTYALDLIKRGTCFLAIEKGGQYSFYPSRFIGYVNNTMIQHENNGAKDWRETNPAIAAAINQGNPTTNSELDSLYKEYCARLGFYASEKGTFGVERKFWFIKGKRLNHG